jgi:hypothetical protein
MSRTLGRVRSKQPTATLSSASQTTTSSLAGRNRILPVWHEITKDEVLSYSPSLADKVALSTAGYTVAEIAHEIAAVVSAAPSPK